MKKFCFGISFMMFLAALPVAPSSAESGLGEYHRRDVQQKEHFERSMEERFRKLGKELDRLKADAKTTTEQGRKEMNRYLAEADRKQKNAARKLEQLQKDSSQKWKKFSDDLESAMKDFEQAYQEAMKRFAK